jgi:hypothetical protein
LPLEESFVLVRFAQFLSLLLLKVILYFSKITFIAMHNAKKYRNEEKMTYSLYLVRDLICTSTWWIDKHNKESTNDS